MNAMRGMSGMAGMGVGGYSPTADSSVRLWLRRTGPFYSSIAGTGTPAIGGEVGYWVDSSGYANHFVAAADNTTRPTLHTSGALGVDFDGSAGAGSEVLFGAGSLVMTGAWSLFLRVNYTATGLNKGFVGRWALSTNQWALLGRDYATGVNQRAIIRNTTDTANFEADTPCVNDGSAHCVGMSHEPATTTVRTWTDGTEITNTVSSIRSGLGVVALGNYGGAPTALAFNCIEVLLLLRATTLAERDAIRQFLVNGT